MGDAVLFDPDLWCSLSWPEQRQRLAGALMQELENTPGVKEVFIQVGPVQQPFDLTAAVETDVGVLRAPLWSHARASIFCDTSIHPANRSQLAPGLAIRKAADNLRRRLAVSFSLESRGLTVTMEPEEGVERTWSAERSRFRGRTAVVREDRIANAAADLDLRDLLTHFYTGPTLRAVAEDGSAFLLSGAVEAEEGELISLCFGCHRWEVGSSATCSNCGHPLDTRVASRPARR